MITILLGTDTLSKQNYIKGLAIQEKVELRKFQSGDTLPAFSQLGEPVLFGPNLAYLFEHCWKNIDPELLLEQCADNEVMVILVEDTVDQRKTVNKNFLRDRRVTVKEFDAPSGIGIEKWLSKRAKEMGIVIDSAALSKLATLLVAGDHEKLSVETAHNELLKLQSYADGASITEMMVVALISPKVGIDTFALLDAIGTKNKPLAITLLNNFFEYTGGDDKAKAIQLSALLADQLRNILLILDAETRNIPDSVILEKTGWKNDRRIFVMKKLARNFTPAQVKQTLSKVENLDLELKSSTMPPHVILDVIISQM